ncbi:MAG TPA: Fic family protein [Verrucomicrobiae bacterium]|jgi:Fic family protein
MKIPESPKPFDELLADAMKLKIFPQIILSAGKAISKKNEYLHWDELRHRPAPEGISSEQWWLAVKLQRQSGFRNIPLEDKKGKLFKFNVPDSVVEQLHYIDRGAGGLIGTLEPVTSPQTRDRYLIRSLIEESITSSQLEGAVTTREVAKQMLSRGRKPRDQSERMILNNYQTMRRIRDLRETPLSPELVIEIQGMLGRDALDKPDAAGRLRRPDEPVEVSDIEGNVFHVPPPAEQLPQRLKAMCDFANNESPDFFIHPVVRAIILHFWLAYDHPFIDGNGRTARALFYWAMLRNGFWLCEFISISQIIIKAPVQYGMAFLHTETDENDLTYFIIHQTEVMRKAVKELHAYITRKAREAEESRGFIETFDWLTHRQQMILTHALKHPGSRYTVAEHRARQGIAYGTARSDLLSLADHNLLEKQTQGREFVFTAPHDLLRRLKIVCKGKKPTGDSSQPTLSAS